MSETKKESPRKYFRHERIVLKVLGVSLTNDEDLSYKIYSFIILFFFHVSYPIIAAGDLFKYELEVVAELYIYVVGTTMGVGIVLVVWTNRIKLGKLIEKIEREPFTPNPKRGGETEEKLLSEWLSFCNVQCTLFYMAIAGSLCPLILITVIKRIRSSDYHDWAFSFGPLTVLNVTYSPNYEISWMYQNVSLLCIGYSMSSCIILLSGILAFISMQFRILQNNIRQIIEIAQRKFEKDVATENVVGTSEISYKYLQETLKEAVEFHISILDVTTEIENTFTTLMLWLYLITLSLLCFQVFRATQIPVNDPRLFRLFVEWSSAAFQPFIICYCGEQVAHESSEVGRAAYEAQFVGTDVRFQKELAIIIRRSQNVMRLKAGKIIETSMATFAWIMRASYSSFMMLRNTNIKT